MKPYRTATASASAAVRWSNMVPVPGDRVTPVNIFD
jgi:hypothetical protein